LKHIALLLIFSLSFLAFADDMADVLYVFGLVELDGEELFGGERFSTRSGQLHISEDSEIELSYLNIRLALENPGEYSIPLLISGLVESNSAAKGFSAIEKLQSIIAKEAESDTVTVGGVRGDLPKAWLIDNPASEFIQQALEAYDRGEKTLALELLGDSYSLNPSEAGLLFQVQLLEELEGAQRAQEFLKAEVPYFPLSWRAKLSNAALLQRLNRHSEAISQLKNLESHNDAALHAKFLLVFSYTMTGEQDKADELKKDILESYPDSPEAAALD
jgi:tetratricopeptide (TPR) repeat protein